ncbi:hypothetical protein H0O00_02580 [Candidatus Micrarchaeota archaeon]|nr:hypothetical protein [Candidatus Micrarchaeota archaeon]
MADVAEKAVGVAARAGGLKELILGILLGAFVLFLLFYFVGPQCCADTDGVKGFFEKSTSEKNETSIIRTSDGSLLALRPSEPGERTTYTDETGKSRSIICHNALYCVEECPGCENETCDGECVQENDRCGYGASTLTALSANAPFYGKCCEGMACLDGYCKRDQCVEDGRFCEYGPTKISTMLVNHPAYYGDCCGNSQCIDGYCTPPEEECNPEGETCGYGQTTVSALVPSNATFLGTCCGDLACINGQCAKRTEECNDKGEFCGYGPTTYTNYQTPTYYGDCCADYQCLNGYCTPPAQTCVKTAGTCGYGQQYATTAAPAGATYYGTCCDGDTCVNGKCTPESGCSEQGQTCAVGQIACCEGLMCENGKCVTQCMETGDKCNYDNDCCEGYCSEGYCSTQCMEKAGASCWPGGRECCEGMTCTNGRCVVPCTKDGEKCSKDSDCCSDTCLDGYCSEGQTCQTSGQCTDSSECCEGYYCSDNRVCTRQPGQTSGCTDSDGSDYYTAGYTTGYYEEIYGTYDDYCSDQSHVVEYTCAATANVISAQTVTCKMGCSSGACNT